MQRTRTSGKGSIRERKGRFYVRYYDNTGKQIEEKAGASKQVAEQLLRKRLKEVQAGAAVPKHGATVTVMDCLRLSLTDMQRRGLKSAGIAKMRIGAALGKELGWQKAASFSWEDAWQYISFRQKDGIKPSTVNRELSQLRAALKLAASAKYRLIPAAPEIPHLDEGDNVRTGFLTPEQYERLKQALPEEIRPLLIVGYYTGLRKGTLLSLRLEQIDLEGGLIWVSRSQTKNRRSHTVPIVGDMRAVVAEALERNRTYLFERNGKPIKSFRDAWKIACIEAGVPGLHFHDLRRTAVRDWLAAGADSSTAMAISGHKTSSMLERYNIIDAANVQRAAALREPKLKLRGEQGTTVNTKPS
ncbi:MAG: site-specific integrase [Bryobacteraceae bacterium]